MALQTHTALVEQLSTLLRDLDAAIRARLSESPRQDAKRELDSAPNDQGVRGIVASALRWFIGSTGSQPTIRRARSPHARPRGPARVSRRRGP